MKPYAEISKWAVVHPTCGAPDPSSGGAFVVRRGLQDLHIIASWSEGWDHVSVSKRKSCPTWSEMSFIKRLFFLPDEVVMQLHVPARDHINIHKNCLHLWRPHGVEIPTPPKFMV